MSSCTNIQISLKIIRKEFSEYRRSLGLDHHTQSGSSHLSSRGGAILINSRPNKNFDPQQAHGI